MYGEINQQGQFRKDASTLVSQLNESLATLGNSRIRHGEIAEIQQRQMAELMSQTQKAIQQCQENSLDLKQQSNLNAQFDGLRKWKKDVGEKIKRIRGHQVLSDRMNRGYVE